MGSSPPFSHASPTPRRCVRHLGPHPSPLPTSASDSALTVKQSSLPLPPPPPPSQPSNVRPFLLRSNSPAAKSQTGSKPRPSSLDSIVPNPSPPKLPYGAAPTRRSGPTVSKSAAASKSQSSERAGGRVRAGSVTSTGGGKVSAVEEQKGRMKRESLLARKENGVAGAVDEGGKSKRWFAGLSAGMGRVVRGAEPVVLVTKKTSLGDLTNRSSSPPPPPPPAVDSFRTPTRPRSISPPRTPTLRASVSISALGDARNKRSGLSQLGLGRSPVKQRAKPAPPSTPDGAGTSYSSLRDMLESSGFTDTRIITPIQRPPLPPPSPTLRPRSSLLSLSSLLTIWAPHISSPPPSPSPLPLSTPPSESHSRALRWAQDVASSLDVPPPPLPSRPQRARSPTPPLPPALSPRKSSAPGLTLANAQRSLRHVVSDPSMTSTASVGSSIVQQGGYQSFSLGGEVVPPEEGRREYGDLDSDDLPERVKPRRTKVRKPDRGKVVEQTWFGGLRERASHVWLGAAYKEEEKAPPVPKLLRKAVSSAVLREGSRARVVVSMEEAWVWPERKT